MKRVLLLMVLAAALGALSAGCSGPTTLPFLAESEAPTTAEMTLASSRTTPASVPSVTTTVATTTTLAPTTVAPTTTTTLLTTTTENPHPPGVLIVGDSILEGLNVLQYSFGPNTIYDTEVSRSAVQLPVVLAEHQVPQNLVVHLGTNGWWPDAGTNFSTAFADLTDRRIALVNLSVDRAYTGLANDELRAVANQHDHVTLVDWNSVATPGMLRRDGFHPNLEGYDVIARMIADALGVPSDAQLKPTTTIQSRPVETGQLVLD